MCKMSLNSEFNWNMAHMLSCHEGLCRNLHGHTYKMQVEVTRKSGVPVCTDGPSKGMIIDFNDLNHIVEKSVVEKFDHSYVYWNNSDDPAELKIAEILKNCGKKTVSLQDRTTVENVASYIFNTLGRELEKNNLQLESIRVWESETDFVAIGRNG